MYRPLDILRAFAVWLMVANHLGVVVFGSMDLLPVGLYGWAVQLGSFAPVIFFFCTGVGYGLKPPQGGSPREWLDLLLKSLILILADQFLRAGSGGSLFGLDFLAFIGLSMFVVGTIAMSPRAIPLALTCILFALACRFAYMPVLGRVDEGSSAVVRWITGAYSVPGVSYPLAPWIVYPLIGFLVGRIVRGSDHADRRLLFMCLGLTALTLIPTYWVIIERGMIIFRWGTVSFGFFVLSLTVLGVLCTAAQALNLVLPRDRAVAGMITIDGIASLAVVPIHYALIDIIVSAGDLTLPRAQFGWLLLAVLTVSILLAKIFSIAANRYVVAVPQSRFLMLALAAFLLLFIVLGSPTSAAAVSAQLIGTLSLCGFLAARRKRGHAH